MNHRSRGVRHALVLGVAILGLVGGCGRPEPGPAAKPVHQSRAKSQYDARVFDASLGTVVAWHDSLGTGWTAAPGPDLETVVETFDALGFALNDELGTLWSRVAPAADAPPVFLDYLLLSAETARSRYDDLRADPEIVWRPNWVPVLSAGDRWLAVESSRSGAPAGPVVAYRPGTEPIVAFTNLTRLFEAIAVVLNDSTTTWTDGRVKPQDGAFRRAHELTNPDLDLPSDLTDS